MSGHGTVVGELPETMDQCLGYWAEHTPDAIAVISGETRLTHGELHHLALRWAGALRARGVGPEAMVGLHVRRSHLTVIAIAAILEVGATYVPLEPSYPVARRRFIAQNAGLKLIVCTSPDLGTLDLGTPTLAIDLDPPGLEGGGGRRATASDIAYLTYTSGSTGTPKGVPMPHRGICQSLRWLQTKFPYRPDDRALFKSPLAFDVSSRWEILWPLASGGAVVIAKPGGTQDPGYLAQLIQDERVTVMHFVPSMLEVFLEEPSVTSCQSLRRVFSGGEALSYALKRRFFARLPMCELIDIYGSTETVVVTYRQCLQGDPEHERPIGRPIAGLPFYLLDDDLRPVETGASGEIFVGGDFLAAGYHGLPKLSAERFIPMPASVEPPAGSNVRPVLFKTGDWARERDNGDIEHLGRRDHQVKIRGVRVELGELEAILEASVGVGKAVVLAHARAGQGVALTAYIRGSGSNGNTRPSAWADALRTYLQGLVPSAMIPAEFVAVDSFPLNPNGKIDRLALANVRAEVAPASEPLTPTETKVASVWQRLLGGKRIGREQDFFHHGGDSLLAMRLLVHIRDAFGVTLAPQDLTAGLTIAKLARWIDTGEGPTHRLDLTVEELRAEVRLAPDIQIQAGAPMGASPPAVVLTGATGYLGAFVLAELLSRTDAIIYCLVRGEPSAAKVRLGQVRDRYGLQWDEQTRVQLISGDLCKPRLGLQDEAFKQLGRRVHAIYHVGAYINEATGYPALREANVQGTHELLRLASYGPAHFHFVSTTAVFESAGYLNADEIPDDAPLSSAERVYGGYAQSKWVAEALVEQARLRGFPATIYRPGSLGGDSRTGRQAWDQLLGSLLRGILVQKAAPAVDILLTLTPVDFVSRAIVYLSKSREGKSGTFNLVNPESLTLARLAELGRELGYTIASQSYEEWVATVSQAIVTDPKHPLSTVFPLLSSTIPGTQRSGLSWSTLTARVQSSAVPVLAQAGITCPPVEKLLGIYLKSACKELNETCL